ncbi:lef-5 [Spodoptera litura granulovirus]|uniref:Lef-5 n=1 Tax=Spodoptera litura granulovirus TaxID=359919 RepID=A5IZS8_9BBAC|nr:lef-5 [Spodoptera litura granulovirus]ABQ52019.1 lef-5 [Spodoptera litura granulovirus]
MPLNDRSSVVKNEPLHLRHLFRLFAEYRREQNYEGLINYLISNYPKNVKNRTFNLANSGHTFHMLYAYIPSVSNKERKQIRLDCIEKLLNNTSNDFKLYEELIAMMGDSANYTCPCELIHTRLQENILYNNNLMNKNFDSKPAKLKKEPIDSILFKYSINWKQTLKKKKSNVAKEKKIVAPIKSASSSDDTIVVNALTLAPSRLHIINGYTLIECNHMFDVIERQLRAGDESVSFIHVCRYCKIVKC